MLINKMKYIMSIDKEKKYKKQLIKKPINNT